MLNNANILKSKKCLVLLLGIVLLAIFVTIYFNYFQNVKAKDTVEANHQRLVDFAKIESQAGKMRKSYGENNTYIDIYLGAQEEILMGSTAEDAINTAEDIYMKREALSWYAAKEGYELSDELVVEMIKKEIAGMKEADNYAEVSAALVDAGTTLEENMLANQAKYKMMYTADIVYKEENKKFLEGDTVIASENTDDWNSYWENLSTQISQEYQKTKDYVIVRAAVEKSKNYIITKQISNEALKSLDVTNLLSY